MDSNGLQSPDELARLHMLGMVDVSPDTLVDPANLPTLAPATIRHGATPARPYIVQMAKRDDLLYKKLTSISGSRWERASSSISYPPTATVALSELVQKAVIADPDGILDVDGVSVDRSEVRCVLCPR